MRLATESIRLVSGMAAFCPARSRVQTPPEAPHCKSGAHRLWFSGCGPRWNPNTGAVTAAMDDKQIVTLMFGSTDTYHCSVGQITSTFSVNNIQSQLSMHVNCATKPGH